jgi:CRISPR-associated protein Csb1
LQQAFQSVLKGNAEPLARLAPTSLVFGVWDSRETQAKVPRLVSSTIRAFNVKRLTRSAQYIPATSYVEDGLLEEPADKRAKDAYAERGFVHVPASGSPGGVIASGGIRRDASLHLAALRLLAAETAERTRVLQRYVLSLALVALTHPTASYLRQGCTLVLDSTKKGERALVFPDGERKPVDLTHATALEYAQAAARAFGLDLDRDLSKPDREVAFDRDLARADVAGERSEGEKGSEAAAAGRRKKK